MNIKIKLLSTYAYMPTRGTGESAGLDFYTPIDIIITPGQDVLIPLDLSIELPIGYVLIMKEKSGLAVKKKIIIGASVIDSDYRGNCHAHLFNLSTRPAIFDKGNKICQGLVIPVILTIPIEVEELNNTRRGGGGFGSTGK